MGQNDSVRRCLRWLSIGTRGNLEGKKIFISLPQPRILSFDPNLLGRCLNFDFCRAKVDNFHSPSVIMWWKYYWALSIPTSMIWIEKIWKSNRLKAVALWCEASLFYALIQLASIMLWLLSSTDQRFLAPFMSPIVLYSFINKMCSVIIFGMLQSLVCPSKMTVSTACRYKWRSDLLVFIFHSIIHHEINTRHTKDNSHFMTGHNKHLVFLPLT